MALGDLPTWLLFVGAVAAAGIALRQLQNQLDDSRRSTRQLERRLAERVDITWRLAQDVLVLAAPLGSFSGVGKAIVIVTNNSGRPIRDVTSRIELPMGGTLEPEMLGVMKENPGEEFDYTMFNPRPGSRVALIRHDFTYGFVFGYTIPSDDAQHPERRAVRPVISFTDDPGLTWDLDDTLRLAKAAPQWPWPWANRQTYRHPENYVRPQVP